MNLNFLANTICRVLVSTRPSSGNKKIDGRRELGEASEGWREPDADADPELLGEMSSALCETISVSERRVNTGSILGFLRDDALL